jgi:hypothetical protein
VLSQSAIEGKVPPTKRNHLGEGNAQQAAETGNRQRLGQELDKDVKTGAPIAFSTPISRVRWVTLTSMIFVSPTPPMPRVRVPMKASRT